MRRCSTTYSACSSCGLACHGQRPAISTSTGARLVTLSNGGASVAEGLLTRAGVRDLFEAVLSVEDAGVWKPAPGSYRYAASRCGTDIAAMMLVAVHPWDVDGAARAGMRSAWINRTGATYPSYFTPPDVEATSLAHLAQSLGQRPPG